MFMFNILDTAQLSPSGSTFVTLADDVLIKLASAFSIKSSIAGSDYSIPDASFAASTWVHAAFIYRGASTKYKVVLNGNEISK